MNRAPAVTTLHARSGKGHRDENFPVASWLVHPRYRAPILAFYEFVRTADDIADHAALAPQEKLALMERLEASLVGRNDEEPVGTALRAELAARSMTPRHALDLLSAFRMDVSKLRYRDWDDLIGYCSLSAMPVGRFVLDVHGESRALWPANDALCAALQIINHLQDCAEDYRNLNRIYIPLDVFEEVGAPVESLAAGRSSPALRAAIRRLARCTGDLLEVSRTFSSSIEDRRLAMEVAVIQGLAERLVTMLSRRDPLSERVHLGKPGVAWFGIRGLFAGAMRRAARLLPARQKPQGT
jgi:hydroxysqualene synthase